jgi:hypothetical protein
MKPTLKAGVAQESLTPNSYRILVAPKARPSALAEGLFDPKDDSYLPYAEAIVTAVALSKELQRPVALESGTPGASLIVVTPEVAEMLHP